MNAFFADFLSLFYIVPINEEFSSVDDVHDYVLKAIPFFLLLVFIEWVAGIILSKTVYSFKDLLMSLSLGVEQQVVYQFLGGLSIIPYMTIYQFFMPLRFILVKNYISVEALDVITNPYFRFIVALLACDLCYYIFHRLAHEYHIVWTGHSVHHSGERYNFATALRQGIMQGIFSWMVYLPLAVFGLSPIDFVRHNRLNLIYQFWIHTELIGQLPLALELILNTPSHHRMHHHPPGNCNYAGVLIIWDRIFCSFVPEISLKTKKHVYGLAQPLNSFDPLFANISHMYKIYESQKYRLSQSSDSSQLSLYYSFLRYVFKKRVDSQWKIASSFTELFPELDKATLFDLISFNKLFAIPSITDESINKSNTTTDIKQEEVGDIAFTTQRSEREGKHLSSVQLMFALIHFLMGLGMGLALLINSDQLYRDSKATLIAGSVLCISTLQTVKWHYN